MLIPERIVWAAIRKLRQFDYQRQDGDLLIMRSDGLTDCWRLSDYPGLARRKPEQ